MPTLEQREDRAVYQQHCDNGRHQIRHAALAHVSVDLSVPEQVDYVLQRSNEVRGVAPRRAQPHYAGGNEGEYDGSTCENVTKIHRSSASRT